MHTSPILWACFNAQLQSLDMLFRHSALVSSVDKQGDTCFHQVVLCHQEFSEGHKKILKRLVGAGADINKPNNNGYSPLFMACLTDKPRHIESLLDLRADINFRSPSGSTPLMEACCKPDTQTVKTLLKQKADMTITNNHGLTALALACQNNRHENVKALINNGAKVTVRDREGRTPLYIAINQGNIEIALEILATSAYLPKDIATEKAFTEQSPADAAAKIEDRFPQALRWNRNGATWLHIAAQYGHTQFLQPDTAAMLPEQLQRVETITKRDSQARSPLTIAINREYRGLQQLFWDEICQLGTTDSALRETHPTKADSILELLAQYEIPGHEEVLNRLLQLWFWDENDNPDKQDYTTLDWAVDRSQAVVLWWLLSKGGYSSGNAVTRALRLVPGEYTETDIRYYVKELLLQPPPILDIVANPNTDRITMAPSLVLDENNTLLQTQGNIVDIYANSESVSIPYKRASVRDIIYDKGPKFLMATAEEDLGQRNLNALKRRLPKPPDRETNGSSRSPENFGSLNSSSAGHTRSESQYYTVVNSDERFTGNLKLRWVHLPVNDLQLMRDLVCRLSHDSNRLELDHSVLMRHFNRSWTELTAGGKRSYMKPQCVLHPAGKPSTQLADAQPSREITCMALYMPYLIVSRYQMPQADRSVEGAARLGLEDSLNNRNSRKVLHEPMTLDQYYYPTILDTDKRDNDQVISKFLGQKVGPEKKILMVNNLWIWAVDESMVVAADCEDPAQESSLLQKILNNVLYGGSRSRFERATTVESVMELILGVAIGSFMEKSISVESSRKGPIEIFREEIRNVSNTETELFETFLTGLKYEADESGILQGKRSWLNSQRYHIISTETELLQRTRDLNDELQILRSLAEDQDIVWTQAFSSDEGKGHLQNYHAYTPADIKMDLTELLLGVEKTTDSIKTLLDLRQAEYSRIQADDSAKQSNSILVFTFVTIVFLPLSFLTSLFALDVSAFPHQSGELKYEGWWLFPILFGVTAIISVPAVLFAWNINLVLRWFRLRANDGKAETPAATQGEASGVQAQQDARGSFRRPFGSRRSRRADKEDRMSTGGLTV
ncbi:hypothetical protein F5Y14DRAFT_441692 [Nemania sp. NC0429]|nr:hypothetical protein F5Y14DRAFT_441692 [Nemania sp. NC0429]